MTYTVLNFLGLDVGGRRIGVSIANSVARLASPLLTIDRVDNDNTFAKIINLIKQNEISSLVVGLPRGMQGQETEQTRITLQFVTELKKLTDVKIHMQDEAATSLKAKDELNKKNKSYQKEDIDKLAATFILQDWLDTMEGNHEV